MVEEGTLSNIFDRPQEEHTRRFLSQVLWALQAHAMAV